MAFRIQYTLEADLDLDYEGRLIESRVRRATLRYLEGEPGEPSGIRRPMDANPLGATWELRLDDVRVFYDIDEAAQSVRVLRVGRKVRETVYLRGRPFITRFQ